MIIITGRAGLIRAGGGQHLRNGGDGSRAEEYLHRAGESQGFGTAVGWARAFDFLLSPSVYFTTDTNLLNASVQLQKLTAAPRKESRKPFAREIDMLSPS